YLELDLKMLEAVAQAHEQRGNGHADDVKLLCPVHYKTLANPELRKKYLQACKQIPIGGVNPKIGFEIQHLPRALYGAALAEPLKALSQVSRFVIVRCPIDARMEEAYHAAGASGVSVHCSRLAGQPLESVHRHFVSFVRGANK